MKVVRMIVQCQHETFLRPPLSQKHVTRGNYQCHEFLSAVHCVACPHQIIDIKSSLIRINEIISGVVKSSADQTGSVMSLHLLSHSEMIELPVLSNERMEFMIIDK